MLIKHSRLSGVGPDGEPLVHVIDPGEKVKLASNLIPEVEDFIKCLRPDPRFTYVLVNAMGYSEYYGANSNKDWYGYNPKLDFNGLLHAPDDWGKDYEKDRKCGKYWPYGYPTYYGATVYAHHQNKDPEKYGFGDIIFVAPNHAMKRIELVKRIDNELIKMRGRASILDRIRHGERVDVSMGCKVPFDLCSICTDWDTIQKAWDTFDSKKHLHPGIAILRYHKTVGPIRGLSITRKDYCEHMRTQAGKILPDGRKVFVYNDFPRFFDNSFVWIGADRTARVMWFLTPDMPSKADILARQQAPRIMIKDRTIIVKTAMEKAAGAPVKLSEMEKEIPGAFAREIRLHSFNEPDIDKDVLEHSSKVYGIKQLLSTLAALGIVLKPGEFQHIVTASKPMGDRLNSALEKKACVFDTSLTKVSDDYVVSGEHFDEGLARIFGSMAPVRSSFAPHLGPRCVSPHGGQVKLASEVRTDFLDEISAQYNGYRISVLEQAPALFPKYASVYPLDPEDLLKVSQAGLASLLLGLGPVVHLVSSHLRNKERSGQDLGTVGKFVADNPNFSRAFTIGAGLRAAMGVQAAGGLGGIASKLVGLAAEKLIPGSSGLVQALGTVARAM